MDNNIETIISLEKRLLHDDVRGSREELDKLLADDFIEFGSSGCIYNKEDILNQLPTDNKIEIIPKNFSGKLLSKDTILLTFETYNITTEVSALRSSIWRSIDNRWQISFHQGTKINK